MLLHDFFTSPTEILLFHPLSLYCDSGANLRGCEEMDRLPNIFLALT